jgi:hypothetical protein
VSLVTLNNATLYNVYIPYITHLICIYCTPYHLLHLAYAVRPSIYLYVHILIHSFVVVKLLDYLLDITAWSELDAQAFRYTH